MVITVIWIDRNDDDNGEDGEDEDGEDEDATDPTFLSCP